MKENILLNIIPDIFTDNWLLQTETNTTKGATSKDNLSIYIHYPFCQSKCAFCQIQTKQYTQEIASQYISSIIKEITLYKEVLHKHSIDCIHFGGGTPSLMCSSDIESIIETINKYADIGDTEIVFEVHPSYVSDDFISCLSNIKMCTVNFGVQSFDDTILSSVNRSYNSLDILKRIETVRSNVKAVGIDIICDLPNSNQNTLVNDMKNIKNLCPDHISQYPFIIQHTLIGENKGYFDKKLLSNDEIIKINHLCEQILNDIGYERYSIYHYSRKGIYTHKYGRSQLIGGKWIGFGAKAYTYLGDAVYVNTNIKEYIQGNYVHKKMNMDYTSRLIWELTFLFRCFPLDMKMIQTKYGVILKSYIKEIIIKLEENNLIDLNEDPALSWKGVVNIKLVEQIIKNILLQRMEK